MFDVEIWENLFSHIFVANNVGAVAPPLPVKVVFSVFLLTTDFKVCGLTLLYIVKVGASQKILGADV